MKNKIEIIQLTDKTSPFLKTITDWQYDYWGKIDGLTFECVKSCMENSLFPDRIPQTFIALQNGNLAGYYQISMFDLEARPDIYPWLINLYVDEKHRGEGVGTALLKSVKTSAKKLMLKELYLYTEHIGLYEKFGWEFVEEIETFIPTHKSFERLYRLKI